jgi:hypothetical protein
VSLYLREIRKLSITSLRWVLTKEFVELLSCVETEDVARILLMIKLILLILILFMIKLIKSMLFQLRFVYLCIVTMLILFLLLLL